MRIVRKNEGITLIALIVLIVVLLILAGVTINSLTGSESAMKKAKEAREKTKTSERIEAVKLAIINSMLDGYDMKVDVAQLQTNLANAGISFTATSLPANIIIDETNYIIDAEGEIAKGKIPTGFVASQADGENTIAGGLVIYEGTEAVTNANVATARTSKNQFVWVQVDYAGLSYSQDHTYDGKHQYQYSNSSSNVNGSTIWTWKDAGGDATSVAKYGGFYIGRYEAGYPDIYKPSTATYGGKDTSKTPVVRKSYAAWNYVSQTSAISLCSGLYSDNADVNCQLIDSYAWDTTVNWFKKTGKVTEKSDGKIDSSNYGNYYTSNFTNLKGILYAGHTNDGSWHPTSNYAVSSSTDGISTPNGTGTSRIEVGTGEIEQTNVNNIYDMAGNMWEWTTEVGDHEQEDIKDIAGSFAVLRGGSFYNNGGNYPVVSRDGHFTVGSAGFINIGFRPVLYLNN